MEVKKAAELIPEGYPADVIVDHAKAPNAGSLL